MVEAEVYSLVTGTAPLSNTLHPSLTGGERSPEWGRAGSIRKMPIHCLLEALGIRQILGETESVFFWRPNLHLH